MSEAMHDANLRRPIEAVVIPPEPTPTPMPAPQPSPAPGDPDPGPLPPPAPAPRPVEPQAARRSPAGGWTA